MLMERGRAAKLGRETVQILERGRYRNAAGDHVDLRPMIEAAARNTRAYPPDAPIPAMPPGAHQTRIEVRNETTLDAARRLAAAGKRVTALNFASAKNPGGGFLGGARAQEESLARSSALVACLNGQTFYDYHRSGKDAMYSDYALYSPDVPVFRTDDGALLDAPYPCSFITCAAVNAKVVLERDPSRRTQIREVMRRRIGRVLEIAALYEAEVLILGAWGCGAFGNDTEMIAELFRKALSGDAARVFAHIVFAITDWSEERRFIGPFLRRFGG